MYLRVQLLTINSIPITRSENGKKKTVRRCISRLDCGTKYCKDSPSIEESVLKSAISEAITKKNREKRRKAIFVKNVRQGIYTPKTNNLKKTVTEHIWSDYLETVEDIRHMPEYKALYERQKETIDRVFANAYS